MRYGSRIAEQRISRGWSREQLAQNLNVSPELIEQWESGACFPDKANLLSLSIALESGVKRLLIDDVDELTRLISITQVRETVCMAALAAVLGSCSLALVAVQATSPELTSIVANAVKLTLAAAFFVVILFRRSRPALQARSYSDALEIINGPQTTFPLVRAAGRNPRVAVIQFILGACIALALIITLGVLVPESNLPWVML